MLDAKGGVDIAEKPPVRPLSFSGGGEEHTTTGATDVDSNQSGSFDPPPGATDMAGIDDSILHPHPYFDEMEDSDNNNGRNDGSKSGGSSNGLLAGSATAFVAALAATAKRFARWSDDNEDEEDAQEHGADMTPEGEEGEVNQNQAQ